MWQGVRGASLLTPWGLCLPDISVLSGFPPPSPWIFQDQHLPRLLRPTMCQGPWQPQIPLVCGIWHLKVRGEWEDSLRG